MCTQDASEEGASKEEPQDPPAGNGATASRLAETKHFVKLKSGADVYFNAYAYTVKGAAKLRFTFPGK